MMTDREPPEPVQISLGEKRFVPVPPASPEPPASPKSIPWKNIGERLAAVPKSIPWKKIGEGLAGFRVAFVNVMILVSFFAIIYFAVAELRREVVVIDPIRLPEALRQMGYSEDVSADRLWDEMARINESTRTAKVPVTLQPAAQKLNFEPPGSGIALQEVVQILRRVLRRPETRIVGEITCMTTECQPKGLALTLRVYHGDGTKSEPLKIIPKSPIGDQTNEAEIDRYFRAAAIELLREIDPYVVALYLYQNQTNKDAAELEALQLIDPTHPDRKWALNLLGFIAADRKEYDAAIGFYERAVKADKKDEFAIAYYNWGNALGAKGELAEAIKKFARATELDPKNAFAYYSWGFALMDNNELAEAIEKFTLATGLDSEYADAHLKKAFALSKLSTGDDPADRRQRYAKDAVDAFQRYLVVLDLEPNPGMASLARSRIKKLHTRIEELRASATGD